MNRTSTGSELRQGPKADLTKRRESVFGDACSTHELKEP